MTMIGTEGGFLAKAATFPNGLPFNPALLTGNLILAPAERADIIVDIPQAAVGTDFILYNDAPAPFPMGAPTNDYYLGNPKNPTQPLPGTGPDTRQVMRIKVVATGGLEGGPGTGVIASPGIDAAEPLLSPVSPNPVAPLAPLPNPAGATVRDLTLNEAFDLYGRLEQRLGTTVPGPMGGFGRAYMDPPTEVVADGAVEVWRIFNTTADTHPMHFHLVNVQVLSRQPFQVNSFKGVPNFSAPARGPELEELGWKETVKMHPGECTTVAMKFQLSNVSAYFNVPSSTRVQGSMLPGKTVAHEYVWHCHILEHEEHDMMRPLVVCS
jgi:spore coat protein A